MKISPFPPLFRDELTVFSKIKPKNNWFKKLKANPTTHRRKAGDTHVARPLHSIDSTDRQTHNYGQVSLQFVYFGLWKETGEPGENPCRHWENNQTLHRKASWNGNLLAISKIFLTYYTISIFAKYEQTRLTHHETKSWSLSLNKMGTPWRCAGTSVTRVF